MDVLFAGAVRLSDRNTERHPIGSPDESAAEAGADRFYEHDLLCMVTSPIGPCADAAPGFDRRARSQPVGGMGFAAGEATFSPSVNPAVPTAFLCAPRQMDVGVKVPARTRVAAIVTTDTSTGCCGVSPAGTCTSIVSTPADLLRVETVACLVPNTTITGALAGVSPVKSPVPVIVTLLLGGPLVGSSFAVAPLLGSAFFVA